MPIDPKQALISPVTTLGRSLCLKTQQEDREVTNQIRAQVIAHIQRSLTNPQPQVFQTSNLAKQLLFGNKYPWYLLFLHHSEVERSIISVYHILGTSTELGSYLDSQQIPYLRSDLLTALDNQLIKVDPQLELYPQSYHYVGTHRECVPELVRFKTFEEQQQICQIKEPIYYINFETFPELWMEWILENGFQNEIRQIHVVQSMKK